jgi:hypothetical protein
MTFGYGVVVSSGTDFHRADSAPSWARDQRGEAELRFTPSFRCYSFQSRCHDGLLFSLHRRPLPPLGWSSCFPRTIQPLLAASPCSRLSRPQSTISQSDFRPVIGSSSLSLVRPYKLRLNPADLPCSHQILRRHAGGTDPGSIPATSPFRFLEFRLPHWVTGSATSTRAISGVSFRSLTFRPIASLSTLRRVRYRTPRKTRYLAAG